jgi:hypothetical protein
MMYRFLKIHRQKTGTPDLIVMNFAGSQLTLKHELNENSMYTLRAQLYLKSWKNSTGPAGGNGICVDDYHRNGEADDFHSAKAIRTIYLCCP